MKKTSAALILFSVFLLSCQSGDKSVRSDKWVSVVSPESRGLDSVMLAKGLEEIRENGYSIDSLTLMRHGDIVLDVRFYPYSRDELHEVASVTKSVMSILIGIAIDKKILRLDDKVISFFPDIPIETADPRRAKMTVKHLLSMSGGQTLCEGSEGSDAIQGLVMMQRDSHWIANALNAPLSDEPGKRFYYFSPGTHLLSAILTKKTGLTARDFADKYLFKPLGITRYSWNTDPDGFTTGWAGLKMYPADMAKIAWLFQREGKWNGEKIVSSGWVKQSTSVQIKTGETGDQYGYGWWTLDDGAYSALGSGGQYIRVFPDIDAAVIITGSGVNIDQIVPHIIPAFKGERLPENREGVAQLQSTIEKLSGEPAAVGSGIPKSAAKYFGKEIIIPENTAGIGVVRFYVTKKGQLSLFSKRKDEFIWLELALGSDGRYLQSIEPDNTRSYNTGKWLADNEFLIDSLNFYTVNHTQYRFLFNQKKVTITVRDMTRKDAAFVLDARMK